MYGHLLVDKTLEVMRDMAYEKWSNRLAHFTDDAMNRGGINDVINKLEREENIR